MPAATGAAGHGEKAPVPPDRRPAAPDGTGPVRGLLRRTLPYAVPFLGRRRGAVVRLGCWSLLESVQTFLGGYGVAAALDRGFLAGRPWVGLGWLAVAAAAVVVGGAATNRVFHHLAGLVEPLRDGLVRRVVDSALSAAVAGRDASGGRTAVSRLTHQTEAARDAFAGVVMVTRSFVFTVAGVVAGLAALAPELLVVLLPPLAAGLALFAAALRPTAARQRDYLHADEELAARIGTAVSGLRDIAACGAQGRTADAAGELIDAQTRAARALARWAAVRTLTLQLAGQAPVVLLLAAAPWLLERGVTAGELLGALTYLTQALLPALNTLMTGLGAAGTRLLVILDRLTSQDDRPPPSGTAPRAEVAGGGAAGAAPRRTASPPAAARPRTAPPAAPHGGVPVLELRSLSFSYGPGAVPVIDRLDLRVEPGEHLAVVGPSGIGKSTLFALAAGLLAPAHGRVLIGGVPVRPPDRDPFAARRALIPQQAYVFGGTLRDNLLYLRSGGAPTAAVDAAVRAVGLEELAHRLGGLDSPVRPSALSQGERQLVALARAYLAPARLTLLDEATCHLDPAAEARAEHAFAERPGTLLVIAHRLSSARRADRVLVLDGTRAVAGRHGELLRRSETYRDLVGHWAPRQPHDR
ncbi:ABC transporter ATP-binding protein [Streptomyces spongiicola]|uniref:ABC transporter ATP-binding protein n=1 Tax=Streptomyces spongiicola TaxID=1690221 RepID=A0ABN5KTD5_9ACTN|nr:ABC transporter ATP-binding protein [Streptomyces spongiicola]